MNKNSSLFKPNKITYSHNIKNGMENKSKTSSRQSHVLQTKGSIGEVNMVSSTSRKNITSTYLTTNNK